MASEHDLISVAVRIGLADDNDYLAVLVDFHLADFQPSSFGSFESPDQIPLSEGEGGARGIVGVLHMMGLLGPVAMAMGPTVSSM